MRFAPAKDHYLHKLPILSQLHEKYLANPALCQTVAEKMSRGGGIGWRLNNIQAMRVYGYQDFYTAFHKGYFPEAARHLEYVNLIGGVEVISAHYRIALNVNKNSLQKGLWQDASSEHPEHRSDYGIIKHEDWRDSLTSKRKYYCELFREHLDLIETQHWSLSTRYDVGPNHTILSVPYNYIF